MFSNLLKHSLRSFKRQRAYIIINILGLSIEIGTLLLAASIMFVATILTIIFKISRAAMKNPVVSLRYE